LLINETKIVENKWGIPEPVDGEKCFPEVFDFVFVPLLVCDQYGNRIGYGKGFYDAFLKKCKKSCKFIGLSHFELEQERIEDILETDIPLHYCITPTKVHSFNH
jgi:5-formyltetrahydrofolate cyclo-ligase